MDRLISRVVDDLLPVICSDPTNDLTRIRDILLGRINAEVALENVGRGAKNSPLPTLYQVHALPLDVIADALLEKYTIVVIPVANTRLDVSTMPVGLYMEHDGIYSADPSDIFRLILMLHPGASLAVRKEVLGLLALKAKIVRRTIDPNLIAVANGIFDHARQELLPFSPDYVFLSKLAVGYDPSAQNPIITMPDGELWDVVSWIGGLSDDEDVVKLLWELISATVRAHVRWNKCAMLMGIDGNNGKSTYVRLLRSLVGTGNYAAIPMAEFKDKYAKYDLLHADRVLVDENPVGEYLDDTKDFKAAVSNDDFRVEAKYKQPFWISWSGFMVQCINALTIRSRDKSGSLTRRYLMVPFTKNFTVGERKYIKDDYLCRTEVLEFVLKTALHMQNTVLSEPLASRGLLAQSHQQNSSALGFWEEHRSLFIWDFLPWEFLYDLFVKWYKRNEPSGNPEGKTSFIANIRSHIVGSSEWEIVLKRPGNMMSKPEPLIAEYELIRWMNNSYSGNDISQKCFPFPLKENYRGLKRIGSGAVTV